LEDVDFVRALKKIKNLSKVGMGRIFKSEQDKYKIYKEHGFFDYRRGRPALGFNR